MTDGGCSNCAGLEAQVSALQRENAALRARVRKLEERIKRLREAIQRVRAYCAMIVAASREVLSTSGHPRGYWSRVKGRYETAAKVLAVLGMN